MLELRLWKFGTDDVSIPSFLEGMRVAHDEPLRTEDWFHWKFEQSPYGKAIMACAFDGDRVAGCVAYGRGIVKYKGHEWHCALSYETFVHPDYQGQGLFKKLISLAEQEMSKAGIQFLYNFPNENSIKGFKHMGWICRNDIRSFHIKICKPLHVIRHIRDLKISFRPAPSNLSQIKDLKIPNLPEAIVPSDTIVPIWSQEYLKWRFLTHPNREYLICDNEDFFAISMIGCRGQLKSAHILYVTSKDASGPEKIMNKVVKEVKKQKRPDIIEYSSSKMDNSLTHVFGFFKVPAHGNFCYKVLDESMKIDDFKIILPSINAHTY